MIENLTPLLGMIFIFLIDWRIAKKYGYPSLSILIAKARKSKYFSWLAWNVWGTDDSLFYDKVLKSLTTLKTTKIVTSMDSESIDQALRRGGEKAISDISIKAVAKERQRKNPAITKV